MRGAGGTSSPSALAVYVLIINSGFAAIGQGCQSRPSLMPHYPPRRPPMARAEGGAAPNPWETRSAHAAAAKSPAPGWCRRAPVFGLGLEDHHQPIAEAPGRCCARPDAAWADASAWSCRSGGRGEDVLHTVVSPGTRCWRTIGKPRIAVAQIVGSALSSFLSCRRARGSAR